MSSVDIKVQLGVDYRRSLHVMNMQASRDYVKPWFKAQRSENEDRGIWSHHFMGNRCGNNGNRDRLYLGASKISADGDCRPEIKRHLLLQRKVMTNLESILKSRDINLPTKVCLVKALFFSSSHVWM